MPRSNIFVILILIIVLSLIGLFIVGKIHPSQRGDFVPLEQQERTTPKSDGGVVTASETGVGPITALATAGKSLHCIYASINDAIQRKKGVVYLDGVSKIRTDFQITRPDTDVEAHIINNGAALFMWTVSEKGRTAVTHALDSRPEPKDPEHVLYDTVRYNCKLWNVDDSLFVVPADITFATKTTPR